MHLDPENETCMGWLRLTVIHRLGQPAASAPGLTYLLLIS